MARLRGERMENYCEVQRMLSGDHYSVWSMLDDSATAVL